MSLVFAIAMWILVEGEKRTEVGFLIPIEFRNLPKDMVIIGEPVKDAEVRVLVSKKVLAKLSPAQLAAPIDLSMAKPGINNLIVVPRDIKIPKGVELIKVNPSSILIHLETIASKLVPVKVKIVGAPASGFRVKGVSVEPDSAAVFGTPGQLKDINEIYTASMDISGIKADKTSMLAIQLADTELKRAEPDVVRVKVSVARMRKAVK
ncbi:MAG: YbbR-like domain-containing protein [Deltaproteobacteria bacterium]|nr:YbbR-like domain-containing protein [Deltaproteobacteria bacterium]